MTTATTTTMRRCVGSTRFGIEAHEAPADDFPAQPSQKDGLGRMCKPHWRAYTNALRKAAETRKAETTDLPAPEPKAEVDKTSDEAHEPGTTAPRRPRRANAQPEPTEADDDER